MARADVNAPVARHLVIRGRVQGVGFRYHTRAEARRLGIVGWVRNRSDGTVEAIVQGDEPAVERLIGWARKGPASARVTDVEIGECAVEKYAGFELRPTM